MMYLSPCLVDTSWQKVIWLGQSFVSKATAVCGVTVVVVIHGFHTLGCNNSKCAMHFTCIFERSKQVQLFWKEMEREFLTHLRSNSYFGNFSDAIFSHFLLQFLVGLSFLKQTIKKNEIKTAVSEECLVNYCFLYDEDYVEFLAKKTKFTSLNATSMS